MKQKLKILFFAVALALCNITGYGQDERQLMQNISTALSQGDCDRAQKNYLAWKAYTSSANASVESRIADCKSKKIKSNAGKITEAKFPGGEDAWRKYVQDNMRQNVPVDNGAPPGQYVVTVSFLVSRDGSISEVRALDAPSPDYGTAMEAVRVIMRGPKWVPAVQDGRPVTYRQRQNIIFTVQNDD